MTINNKLEIFRSQEEWKLHMMSMEAVKANLQISGYRRCFLRGQEI